MNDKITLISFSNVPSHKNALMWLMFSAYNLTVIALNAQQHL